MGGRVSLEGSAEAPFCLERHLWWRHFERELTSESQGVIETPLPLLVVEVEGSYSFYAVFFLPPSSFAAVAEAVVGAVVEEVVAVVDAELGDSFATFQAFFEMSRMNKSRARIFH